MPTLLPLCLITLLGLARADSLQSDRLDGTLLKSDLTASQRAEVFSVANVTERKATEFLEDLGTTRKSTQDLRLRVYDHDADYEDWRRRTRDQSTRISSQSFYDERTHEVVLAWTGGTDTARAQLRRQVARHVLLQFAKSPANWFEEGFAGYFEGLVTDPYFDVVDSVNTTQLDVLRRAFERKAYCPLPQLMDLQEIEFYGLAGARESPWPRTTLYAESWGLVYYLFTEQRERVKDLADLVVERLDTGRWNQSVWREKLEVIEPAFKAFIFDDDLRRLGTLTRDAWQALREDDPRGALSIARHVLEFAPERRSALRVIARAAFRLEDYDLAIQNYESLLACRKSDVDAALGAAEAWLEKLKAAPQDADVAQHAIAAARAAAEVSREGERHVALSLAADAAELHGDYQLALDLVREALRARATPSGAQDALKERERRLIKRAIGK